MYDSLSGTHTKPDIVGDGVFVWSVVWVVRVVVVVEVFEAQRVLCA